MKIEIDDVHLWITRCSEITDPSLLHEYQSLLSTEELDRQQHYTLKKSRHRDLTTRVLVRTTLSRYNDINAKDWRFETGENGKPEISAPNSVLRFNLSHAENYIVLAITQCRDIGVDIEYMRRKSDYIAIADQYFSDSEIADLSAMPVDIQRERFYGYWTLKEAYIKACGLGLTIPLNHFSFYNDLKGDVKINISEKLGDIEEDWKFWRFKPYIDYCIALALRCKERSKVTVRFFETIPLKSFKYIDIASH